MTSPSDLDIYRSANILIKQHGEDAAIHAAMKTDELSVKGDVEGAAVWKRIVRAIDELSCTQPHEGVSRH
jgi:hypothetical protein